MDYLTEYKDTKSWVRKAILMNLLHTTRKLKGHWSVSLTAQFFDVSIGLVSENLKLAKAFDGRPELMKCESRQKALDVMERRNGARINFDEDDD